MKTPYTIVKRPLLTEKSSRLRETGGGVESAGEDQEIAQKVSFEVDPGANKIEIRAYTPRQVMPDGARLSDAWQLARTRCMAMMSYLTSHGIDAERIRISQDGALEPNTLYTDDGKQVPAARIEVFALDEHVDKANQNTPPETAGAQQH